MMRLKDLAHIFKDAQPDNNGHYCMTELFMVEAVQCIEQANDRIAELEDAIAWYFETEDLQLEIWFACMPYQPQVVEAIASHAKATDDLHNVIGDSTA